MRKESNLEYKLRYDKDIPISEVLIRINSQLGLYDHFVIVEGIGDIVFYTNSGVLKNIDNLKMIAAPSENVDVIVGKKYVINSYQLIKKCPLGKEMYKYIFIVDRDYNGIERYYDIIQKSFVKLEENEKRCISCTKQYAIENYFLEEKNLKKIFTLFEIDNKFDTFYNEYLNFIKETKELFALVATSIYAIENGINLNKFAYKMQDVFRFNFKNKYIYNEKEYVYDREKYILAVNERKDSLSKNQHRKELYNKKKEYEENIESNNYIQGHTAYNFLKEYIKTISNNIIDIEPIHNRKDYISILKNIDVDIDLKYGNGKKV